jgi:hypothetical protein
MEFGGIRGVSGVEERHRYFRTRISLAYALEN